MIQFTSNQLVRLWDVYLITAPLAFLLGPLFGIGEFQVGLQSSTIPYCSPSTCFL